MKVAVAQMACSLGNVEANVKKMGEFSARAKANGADLIVFPELADTGYSMTVIPNCAQSWNDGSVAILRKIAEHLSIAIIAGVSERAEGVIYNSQVFIDSAGRIVGSYRKTHLFKGRPAGEDECFLPGDQLKSFGFGDVQLGLSICYDLRFPEL